MRRVGDVDRRTITGQKNAVKFFLVAALVAAGFGLAGCTPTFNWRSFSSPDGFECVFPGRVDSLVRTVTLPNLSSDITMHGVEAGQLTFVVGVAEVATAQNSSATQLADAIRAGLSANFSGGSRVVRPVSIHRSVASLAEVAGTQTIIKGTLNGQPGEMSAIVVPLGQRVFQIAVAGPAAIMDSAQGQEAVDTFLSSVRLN